MSAPSLYYLSPEWDKYGRFTRDSLVWSALGGNHTQLEGWAKSFQKHEPLASKWVPPVTMVERGKDRGDIIAACRETFAVTPAAWKAIRDLVEGTVEALSVQVTHSITPEKFDFDAIPRGKQPKYLLLHGLFEIPLRHGQRGYWDVNKNRYDMSMGKMYGAPAEACRELWLDPDEFAGKHLFLLDRVWVASAEFVERVKAKKLTGLVCHPIRYEVKASPAPIQTKKVLPQPPKPDFAAATKGYSQKLAGQWQELWQWTGDALKNRGWPARKPKLKPPVTAKQLRDFESKRGIKLPQDYADVLTQFASEVTVDLGWIESSNPVFRQRDEIERRLRGLMFGGKMPLWSFSVPVREYDSFKKWGDSLAQEEPDDEYYQHLLNKLPILQIQNGDYIALDLRTSVPTYISHEGDATLQGKPLGKSFVDFITHWSWVGLPWPDFLPDTEFYDAPKKQLSESSPALACWHAWLRGAPLPAEKG